MEEQEQEQEQNPTDYADDTWFDSSKVNIDDAMDKFKFHVNRMNENPKFTIKDIDCRDIWFKLDDMHSLNVKHEVEDGFSLWVARIFKYAHDTQNHSILMSPSHQILFAYHNDGVFYNYITKEEV